MPLPPYIHEKLKEKDRYQNVYSKPLGSAACPTAGLHFTEELLNKIKEIRREGIPKLARYADKEANPLYPVPVLMDAKELEFFYNKLLEE